MYYGYRCYNKDGEPLGWFYTYKNDTEITWTTIDLNWCKRWKTEQGAKKNFDRYNRRWRFKSSGGYLKIEVMPNIQEPESAEAKARKLLEEWGDNVTIALCAVPEAIAKDALSPNQAELPGEVSSKEPSGFCVASPNSCTRLQFLSFHPQPEILQWLSEERNLDENGELESDDTLINRKLEKLRKLEQQGF